MTNAPDFKVLPINTGSGGNYNCFNVILQKIHERFEYMIRKHCKVMFIRFDLQFPENYLEDKSNDKVSRFFKLLKEHYNIPKIEFHYVWVREQSRFKHQHYHCLMLMDANKIYKYYCVLKTISEYWGYILGINPSGLVDSCDRGKDPVANGILICRPSSRAEGEIRSQQEREFQEAKVRCFEWASYLAKVNQKSNIPDGVKRYGASQLPGSYSRFQFTIPVSV